MKKFLCLFLFASTISAEAQTSAYHPFPDSNAVWNINHFIWWGCGPPTYAMRHELFSYVLNGDTAINSDAYHKIYVPVVQINCNFGLPYQAAGYKGCLREDTLTRRVYFVYPNDTVDSLLYDFTLQVGDTVKGILAHAETLCGMPNPPLTIYSVDSILIDNGYRKQWNYSLGSIVEGIGSLHGLLETACQFPDLPEAYLSCFKQGDSVLYYAPWFPPFDCNLIDGVNPVYFESHSLNLFPNPATNELTVRSSVFGEKRIELIEILDALGQNIFSQKINNQQPINIDVAGWNNGIYFVKLKTLKGEQTQKLIIQH